VRQEDSSTSMGSSCSSCRRFPSQLLCWAHIWPRQQPQWCVPYTPAILASSTSPTTCCGGRWCGSGPALSACVPSLATCSTSWCGGSGAALLHPAGVPRRACCCRISSRVPMLRGRGGHRLLESRRDPGHLWRVVGRVDHYGADARSRVVARGALYPVLTAEGDAQTRSQGVAVAPSAYATYQNSRLSPPCLKAGG
jgi:hypothetical protein